MSKPRSSTRPTTPARLALSLPDHGRSGLIDIANLRAEPVPLSLVSGGLTGTPPPPPPTSPSRRWGLWAIGSAAGLMTALTAMVIALQPTPTIVVERHVPIERQLSMQEVDAAPVLTTVEHDEAEPASTKAEANTADSDTEASAPAAKAKAKTKTKTKRRRSRTSRKDGGTKTPSKANQTKSPKAPGASIPIECVLDPASCSSGGKPKPKTETHAPKALPQKLSASQLKAALATTKLDARRCGPKHGASSGEKVQVKLSIAGDSGRVISSAAQGDHAGTALGQCVAKSLGSTKFPRFTAARMGTIYSVRL